MNKKSEIFRLWTPVANALEVYKRGLLSEPEATYEHLWRLVHIHEALVVTLGAVLASRLLSTWDSTELDENQANRLRAMVTGLSTADEEAIPQPSAGGSCMGGSIQAWIDLLRGFGGKDIFASCDFCSSLSTYLATEEPKAPIAFLEAWKSIGPVPRTYSTDLNRISRFDAINSLRNKLAHVPLPKKLLSGLHKGLRQEVLSALSPEYNADLDNPCGEFRKTKWHPPLCGRIITRGFWVTGSDFGRDEDTQDTDEAKEKEKVKIQPGGNLDRERLEPWVADPFFRVDEECKVSVLFRISDEIDAASDSLTGEYHRFAAEFHAMHSADISKEIMEHWYPKVSKAMSPVPTSAEPLPEKSEGVQTADDPYQLRSRAELAFRNREYHQAVEAFDALSSGGDPYRYNDVAKSKHGAALWRLAYASDELSREEKIQKIKQAVDLLKKAATHIDPAYGARAQYEKSKAYDKLWQLTSEENSFCESHHAAEEALKLDPRMEYITWFERLDRERETRGIQCGV